MRTLTTRLLAACALAAGLLLPAGQAVARQAHYDHVFLVVEENNGFSDIIGNKAAPNFNRLADTYGLATDYYGVSHPSEPNYVAMLGGDTFGVASDNPYWTNTVGAPNLISQLDAKKVSWKAYLQSVPYAGYQGMCYPVHCNGTPDSDPLYVAKHNGIVNFAADRGARDWSRQVPFGDLSRDLRSGSVPAFSYVIPDECHDQHGDPPACIDSGNIFDPQNQRLVSIGDDFLGRTVQQITSAPFWSRGNNAIVVTYDEGDDNAHGGGQVATVAITSHGPRGVKDGTFYNHYSLLRTLEDNYGVACLAHACDASSTPMSPLFAVTGSTAAAYRAVRPTFGATPTPVPLEPVSVTTNTPRGAGWSVVSSPLYGTNNNSLGAVAASGPKDVWAVGNYLPDSASPNQDATLPLAEHYDGTAWKTVPTPKPGPNFATLFGVAAVQGKAWTAGVYQDAAYRTRALVEYWDGSRWSVVNVPQPGTERDMFYGVSADSPNDVWAVGLQQGTDGVQRNLVEHFDGRSWRVASLPGAGAGSLNGVQAVSPNDVYVVGQRLTGRAPDQMLAEHWDGSRWSVLATPHTTGNSVLYGVAVSGGEVYATGESDSVGAGARPLVVRGKGAGPLHEVVLPAKAGSNWTNMYGIAIQHGRAYAVGTYYDAATGNNAPLLLSGVGDKGWQVVDGPNPSGGKGGDILGGIADAGGTLWIAGTYDTGGNHLTMLEHN